MLQRWRVGDVEVVRVVDFQVGAPSDRPVPGWLHDGGFTDDAGDVLVASSAILVMSGGRRVVVDPWLVFDGERTDLAAEAGRAAALLDELAEAGAPADDVDVVVDTHVDGVGWNVRPDPTGDGDRWVPAFPRARYRLSRTELDLSADDRRLDPLRDAGVVDPVDPPDEIAPGVTVEEVAGHRPGHLVVRIADGGEEALVPGHLVISPLQVADPTIALDEDPAAATAIRRRLLGELAERGGRLIGSLVGGPGGGVVRPDGDAWRLDPG